MIHAPLALQAWSKPQRRAGQARGAGACGAAHCDGAAPSRPRVLSRGAPRLPRRTVGLLKRRDAASCSMAHCCLPWRAGVRCGAEQAVCSAQACGGDGAGQAEAHGQNGRAVPRTGHAPRRTLMRASSSILQRCAAFAVNANHRAALIPRSCERELRESAHRLAARSFTRRRPADRGVVGADVSARVPGIGRGRFCRPSQRVSPSLRTAGACA